MTSKRAGVLLLVGILLSVHSAKGGASTAVCEITYTTMDESTDEFRKRIKQVPGTANKDEIFGACEVYGRHYLSQYPFHKIRTIKIEVM